MHLGLLKNACEYEKIVYGINMSLLCKSLKKKYFLRITKHIQSLNFCGLTLKI
jgi:hypothetical protein